MTSLNDPFFSSFLGQTQVLYRKAKFLYKQCYVIDKKGYIFGKINLKRIAS